MRRRLDLAAALVANPDLLILDEPTTGLDPTTRDELWALLRRLQHEDGKTLLLTTQYLEEADALCDRLLFLNRGRVVAEGRPTDLKRAMGSSVLRFEVAGPEPATVLAVLKGIGIDAACEGTTVSIVSETPEETVLQLAALWPPPQLRHLTIETPSLDDVFRRVILRQEGHIYEISS
jgi:ABC-type multidrug transport system ATPase subunit